MMVTFFRGSASGVGEQVLALAAEQDLVPGPVEILGRDLLLMLPGREQGRLVHQVLQVGAGKAHGAPGYVGQVHPVCQGHVPGMDPQDFLPGLALGPLQDHLAVEATGPHQGRIQHVGPVGGGDDHYRLVRLEAVHLHQDLVQRLLALVVAAPQAGAALAAHGVDLVDEDNGRGLTLGVLEQVAHPRGPHPHEHFHELGA